jgi:hypothetical protein
MKYVLLSLLFLFPICPLAQEGALTGGAEDAQKESSAVDKESIADSEKKHDRWALVGIIATIFIIGVILLIVRIVKRREKERTLILNALAMEIGLDFLPAQDDELLAKMQVFSLFNKGCSREMKNVMKTKTDNVKMTLFDYAYTTGGGENSKRYSQTIVTLEHDSLSLPKFTLSPKRLFDKIGAALGFQDIDFDEHPEFSKSFVLKGEDEPAIRKFFDREKLEFFAQRKESYIETAHSFFIYTRDGRKKPEQIRKFLKEGHAVYTALGGQSLK